MRKLSDNKQTADDPVLKSGSLRNRNDDVMMGGDVFKVLSGHIFISYDAFLKSKGSVMPSFHHDVDIEGKCGHEFQKHEQVA